MTEVPKPIIIDTDPGQDDAIAILLALGNPAQLDVLGITTVAGNVPLQRTQRNARIVCEWAQRSDIPVFAGCDRPLQGALITAEEIHGGEGLEGPSLHEPTMPLQPQHAVDWLIDTITSSPEPVTLCALGPLTNIGQALTKAPAIARRIREIVVMGGARSEGGNVTPCAEFNMRVDPHAAQVVLRCGAPVTVLPLDVTHQVLATPARVQRLLHLGNRAGTVSAQILSSYERAEQQQFGNQGAPLHDPCVIAWLLAPQLFGGKLVNIEVETESPLTMGATVVDWWQRSGRTPNARYINKVDAAGFFELLTTSLARLP